jgi:hypothetical protein
VLELLLLLQALITLLSQAAAVVGLARGILLRVAQVAAARVDLEPLRH